MKLSIKELQSVVATYINATKIGGVWNATTNNVAGLLDKIGKTFQIDGMFEDKLSVLDGEELPLGKTIEEWYQDLILPSDYDSTGSTSLAPNDPTYRPVSYSYSLGRKKFKITERYDNYERACNTSNEFNTLVNSITKRLFDSLALFKFNSKKELLAKYGAKAIEEMTTTTTFSASATYAVNVVLKNGSTTTRGIVVKPITSNQYSTWALAVAGGSIIELDLVSVIAQPIDTSTGEAFIKQIKKDVKTASFANEGHSLNGNTIGSTEGLLLIINKDVMPSIEVDVMAGAFNGSNVSLPATIIEVDNFGNDTNGIYAMLIDSRGARLHQDYQAIRTQPNADGDFMNSVLHYESTAFYSRNTFIKVYKGA